ncbi:hypothetical protein [Balneola vulgaris]|uniref:hypothetical protein n=1 Tax=Balneola vulgaris TaxID=287535 RepID=UPI00037A9007|nr:hypothetical protein [Balneola vulgaris]
MNNRLLTLTVFLFLLFPAITNAQNAIAPDRPGAGYSSSIVESGSLYLEGGVFTDTDYTDFGQLFIRTGLAQDLELQFNLGSLEFVEGRDKALVTSQSIALKYGFGTFGEDQNINFSVLARMNLPFLNENYEYYYTRFLAIADISLNDNWGVNTNFGYGDFLNEFGDGNFNFNFTPGVSLNESTSAYFGYAVTFDSDFNNSFLEGGLTHLVDESLQLDAGLILNDNNDLFLTFGIAKRF